ncbi:MAG: hypothetical protein IJ897_06110 [Prevotella sp.]|nr:hypothetical protein [Prevotella sp.]
MKKLKLLFATFALLLGVSNAMAQVDVTSTYLTNADFSSTDGWTQTHSADYWSLGNGLIGTYAVANNKTSTTDDTHLATEYCFGIQCRWSTNYAQFTQTATLPAGNYLLAYDVENTNSSTTVSDVYDNRFYVQVGETKYEDTSVEWMMGERGWTQHIISFSLESESSVTISLGYGTGSNNYGSGNTPHLYVSHLELIYSASNALDHTSKIANNSFESGDTGWTHGSSSDTGVKDNSGNYATTGTDGSKLFNTWWQGVPITQTIENVPNGKYVIKAALAGSDDNDDAKLYLIGPSSSTHSDLITIYHGTKGTFHDYAFEVLVTNKSITLGAVGGNADGTYNANGHWWYKADNFRLYYLGEDLSMYETPFANAQTYAKGINQSAPMNATVLSTLQSAISDYGDKAFSTFESSDDIIAAIDALNNAADAATTSISNYVSALAILDAASSFDATGQASYDANGTVAAIQSAYDARTLTAVTSEQESNCAAALRTAALAQTTENSDMTLGIANHSFETASSAGWTIESTGSNINLVFPNTTAFTKKEGTYFAERYQPNGTIEINQTLNIVTAGVYKVEMSALARGDVSSANFYANSVSTPISIVDAANDYSVNVALDANSELKIGLTVVATASGGTSWLAFDNFRLTYLGGLPDVVAVEGKMNATVAAAQTSAIAAYEASKTVANYNAASVAIAAAQASKDAYTAANVAITKAEELQTANTFVTSAAATTFAEAIAAIKTPYTNGTLSDENAAAAGATLGVVAVGWHSEATNTPASNYIGSTWDGAYTINDWSVEGESDGSNYVVPFFQNWTNDGNSLGTTTMTGTLTGLSAGIYKVSAWVRVRAKNGVAATEATGITMDVNGSTAVDVTEGVQVGTTQFQMKEYEATGYVMDDGVLNVNFNIADGNNISWLSYKNITYTRTGDAYASVTIGATGWTTFASSNAVNLSDLDGATAYYASAVDGETVTMTSTDQAAVAEGEGIMLKGTAGAIIIVPYVPSGSAIDGNLLVGCPTATTITNETAHYANIYVLGIKSGTSDVAEFQNLENYIDAGNSVEIPAGKAYLDATASNGARGLRIVIGADITGIDEAKASVEAVQKDGKFFKNGKLFIFKNGKKYNATGAQIK